MIQRALAFLREVRNAPVHPVTAGLGAVSLLLGAAVVQRYVAQQQAGLAHAWAQLKELQAGFADVESAYVRAARSPKGHGDDGEGGGWLVKGCGCEACKAESDYREEHADELVDLRAQSNYPTAEDLDPVGRGETAPNQAAVLEPEAR